MLPVNKKDLVHVLNFLEEKAEPIYQQTLKEAEERMSREEMLMTAERALELEKSINTLLDQVDKLQQEKDTNVSKLLNAVDKIKGKSIKIGNILMMVHETIQKNPSKITYKYKPILDKILETYEIEARFVTRLKNKYKTVIKGSTHVSKELEMQREAQLKKLTKIIEAKTGKKVLLKEGFWDWITISAGGLIMFFITWYRVLAPRVNEIQELFEDLHELAHHAGLLETEDKHTQDKFHKVMGEFKKGMLKSSSGQKVTDRKQALAIASSESGISKTKKEAKQTNKKKTGLKKEADSFFPAKPTVAPIGAKTEIVKHDQSLHEDETETHEEKSEKEEKEVGEKISIKEKVNRFLKQLQQKTGKKISLKENDEKDQYWMQIIRLLERQSNIFGNPKEEYSPHASDYVQRNANYVVQQFEKGAPVEETAKYLIQKAKAEIEHAHALDNGDKNHKVQFEAMNRPDEQKVKGRKPVLDADQHIGYDEDGQEIYNAKYKKIPPRIKMDFTKMRERYGLWTAAYEFVSNYGKTDVSTLMQLFNITEEKAEDILERLDNGADSSEPIGFEESVLHERTEDEVKAITGKHKMNEMRPDEIEATTGRVTKIMDADEHLDETVGKKIYILFSGQINFMKKSLIPFLQQKNIKFEVNKSEDTYGMKLLEIKIDKADLKQIDLKPETIGSFLEKKDKKGDLYGGWIYEDETNSDYFKEVQDLDEEDYPWKKCMRDQKKEYGSKETAKKVCGSIKAKYGEGKESDKKVIKEISYKPYTGPAGPETEQKAENTLVLFQKLQQAGVPCKMDNGQYAKKVWDGDEKMIVLGNGKTRIYVSYDRWGYAADGAMSEKLDIDQSPLDYTLKQLIKFYKPAIK